MELLTIPAVVAIIEALKLAGLPSRFAPIASIALGMGMGVLFIDGNAVVANAAVGILIGLSASGLYSGGKTLMRE